MNLRPLCVAARLFGSWVHVVDRASVRADLSAGILGALLVLPQAIAFASLAGLPPEYGLYTAIVSSMVAALFGSSWHVVSGPTNANSLVLFASLAPLAAAGSPAYIQLALAVTVMVGIMQWLLGALRLGALANFISPSALRGFMTGAALLIALHSLPDLLGLASVSGRDLEALFTQLGAGLAALSPPTLLISACTLVAVVALRRIAPRSPHMLVALILATVLSVVVNRSAAGWGSIATTGSIPSFWPIFRWPVVEARTLRELLPIAFALTIVASGQTIAIARSLAARSHQEIDANREFRGQGLSNLIGGFFSCYVSCGSLNRSLPNFEGGARTPLAAVFASFWLLALLALTGGFLAFIPTAAIAALLLVVAWSLLDIGGWRQLWALSRSDFAIAAVTALATITVRMEIAILLGTILSLVTYLHRTSRPHMRVMGFDIAARAGEISERPFVVRNAVASPLPECPQLKMVRMEGAVYFGAIAHVAARLRTLRTPAAAPKHLLVMTKSMNFIDLAAVELWRSEMAARRAAGGDLYFHRPRPEVLELWGRTGFINELGEDHLFSSKRLALASIFQCLDRSICDGCTVRVFDECQSLPKQPRSQCDIRVIGKHPSSTVCH